MKRLSLLLLFPLLLTAATDNFYVAQSNHDGRSVGVGASYPPSQSDGDTDNAVVTATRTLFGGNYIIRVGLVWFDTSALPDNAVITAASLHLHAYRNGDTDSRNLAAEYYTESPPVDLGRDYTTTAATTAFSVDLTTLQDQVGNAQWEEFTLTSPAENISKTGYTGFRFHITGGQPSGTNLASFYSYDGTNPPYLSVTYTVPSPKIIIVNSD